LNGGADLFHEIRAFVSSENLPGQEASENHRQHSCPYGYV
jgi:hypothetical protein